MQTDPWKVTPSLVPWFAIWITIYCLGFSPMDHLMLFPLNLSYYYAAYLVLPLQFFCISKLYSWMMHGDVPNFLPECQPGSPELLRNCSFIWLLTSQNPDNWTPRIWSQYIWWLNVASDLRTHYWFSCLPILSWELLVILRKGIETWGTLQGVGLSLLVLGGIYTACLGGLVASWLCWSCIAVRILLDALSYY